MKATITIKMRKRAWVFWQRGPFLLVIAQMDTLLPLARWPFQEWQLHYVYAVGLGAWIWQRSNMGRIVTDTEQVT